MSDNLKPCPFCGGKAQRLTIGEDEPNNAGGDVIDCTVCHASSYVEFGRKENLVSNWNHRSREAQLEAALEPFVQLADKRDEKYRKRGGKPEDFPDSHPAYDIAATELKAGIWRRARAAIGAAA